jgi:predicted CxxxxCH...CXXCH cytochrome family protein
VMHVNGTSDVAFDQTNNIVYNVIRPNITLTLSGASYDPSTKTCSNVSCHYGNNTLPPGGISSYKIRYQQKVKWGAPFRPTDSDAECDLCHRTILPKTCP